MTFSIKVIGDVGQQQIDDGYSNQYSTTTSPILRSAGSASPTLNPTDLLIGRLPYGVSNTAVLCDFNPPASENYILRNMAGNLAAPASGFGVSVFDSAGHLLFSSLQQRNFAYVASGAVAAIGSTQVFSTASNLSKHWCLLFGTYFVTVFSTSYWVGYSYHYDAPDSGSIWVTKAASDTLNWAIFREYS